MIHHAEALKGVGGEEGLVSRLRVGDRSAVTDPGEVAMLDYSAKLTQAPATVTKDDVDGLRTAGWSDSAILDIAQVCAYFNFVNRMADGLGVELESS